MTNFANSFILYIHIFIYNDSDPSKSGTYYNGDDGTGWVLWPSVLTQAKSDASMALQTAQTTALNQTVGFVIGRTTKAELDAVTTKPDGSALANGSQGVVTGDVDGDGVPTAANGTYAWDTSTSAWIKGADRLDQFQNMLSESGATKGANLIGFAPTAVAATVRRLFAKVDEQPVTPMDFYNPDIDGNLDPEVDDFTAQIQRMFDSGRKYCFLDRMYFHTYNQISDGQIVFGGGYGTGL